MEQILPMVGHQLVDLPFSASPLSVSRAQCSNLFQTKNVCTGDSGVAHYSTGGPSPAPTFTLNCFYYILLQFIPFPHKFQAVRMEQLLNLKGQA